MGSNITYGSERNLTVLESHCLNVGSTLQNNRVSDLGLLISAEAAELNLTLFFWKTHLLLGQMELLTKTDLVKTFKTNNQL